jgi:hypothetical protein
VPYTAGNTYWVTEGAVGWAHVPDIVSNDTNESWVSVFGLNWHGVIPGTGTFRIVPSEFSVQVDLRWLVEGSGLWGTDAKIEAVLYAWVSVGGQQIAGSGCTLISETKASSGSNSGSVNKTLIHSCGDSFSARAGEDVWVVNQLQIEIWSQDGRAWVGVDGFWIPRVEGADHMFGIAHAAAPGCTGQGKPGNPCVGAGKPDIPPKPCVGVPHQIP